MQLSESWRVCCFRLRGAMAGIDCVASLLAAILFLGHRAVVYLFETTDSRSEISYGAL